MKLRKNVLERLHILKIRLRQFPDFAVFVSQRFFAMFLNLSLVCFAQANDANTILHRRKANNKQSLPNIPARDPAPLRITLARIFNDNCR